MNTVFQKITASYEELKQNLEEVNPEQKKQTSTIIENDSLTLTKPNFF